MWEKVLGHEDIKSFLKQYIIRKEKPHALLFVGAPGLGKELLAKEFAKALLCASGNGMDNCEACRRMDFEGENVSHPDFVLVPREINPTTGRLRDITIEQVRELQGKTAFAPVSSKYKVCLIEAVDRMRAEAANCLLKLLEEPPEGWVLILLAESEEKLLETILSRVVVLRFHSISRENVARVIKARYPELEKERMSVLAEISEGSIGRAIELQEQGLWEKREQALALLEAFPMKGVIGYLADRTWLEKLERAEALLLVNQLQALLRDALIVKNGIEKNLYNSDLEEDLQRLASKWSDQALKKSLQILEETYRALEGNAGIKLSLEAMTLKIDKLNKE